VTALPPGWHNHYQHDDAIGSYPCPAILLQETREKFDSWDETDHDGRTRRRLVEVRLDPPYETRAVFAAVDGAELHEAAEASNYLGTTGPGEPCPEVPPC
jgi:hypothetical protein